MNINPILPLTDNQEIFNELQDLTIDSGELVDEIEINGINLKIFDYKEEYFGLRAIIDDKKDFFAFYPIVDYPESITGKIKSISELENCVEAIQTTKVENALLTSLSQNYYLLRQSLPSILDSEQQITFSAFALSQEPQTNPPQVRQKDGSLLTTKGSSIFYNVEGTQLFEYVYQLNVEKVNSIIWHDYLEIFQIKTTLFRLNKTKASLYLYTTERVLQNNYYPKKGEDILGVMQLFSCHI